MTVDTAVQAAKLVRTFVTVCVECVDVSLVPSRLIALSSSTPSAAARSNPTLVLTRLRCIVSVTSYATSWHLRHLLMTMSATTVLQRLTAWQAPVLQ